MNIPIIRSEYDRPAAQLRRARKLYARLIWKELTRNPDLTFICAQRAIARGLYSPKSGFSDVVFSLVRWVHKMQVINNVTRLDWWSWRRENEHADWFKCGHKAQKKNGKFLIKVRA